MRRLVPFVILWAGCAPLESASDTAETWSGGAIRVSPGTAAAGLARTVSIVGTGTDWAPGEVAVDFGEGVDVLTSSVASSVLLQATVEPREGAALGTRDVTVTWGDRRLVGMDAFAVETGAVSVSPSGAHLGETVRVQVVGHRTNFRQGLTSISLGDGIRVDDVTVEAPDRMTFSAHVALAAPVGPHDFFAHNAGTDVVSRRGAFVVDRTARTFTIDPAEAWQGDQLTAVVEVPGLALETSRTELDLGTGVLVQELEVTGPGQATVQLRIGNNAAIGPRDVELTFDDPFDLPEDGPVERLKIDGFTVHPVESTGLAVRVSVSHGISRTFDQGTCSWAANTYANATFFEANDFPCPGSGSSSTLGAPPRWDQFSTGHTNPAVGSTDCPAPRTFDAGPYVLLRAADGLGPELVLDRNVQDFTGRVSYSASGLIPSDYRPDALFDLVVPGGDLGYQELPPWEVPDALHTLPRDFRQSRPDYCGLEHPVDEELLLRWEPAGTYDVADMNVNLTGSIQDEGYPVLLLYPWDDGAFDFPASAVAHFEEGPATLSQTASRRLRFDVPGTEITGGGFGSSNLFWRGEFEFVPVE